MRTITAEMLRRHFVCENEVKLFAQEWPDGARVTVKNVRRAGELGFDLGWVAAHLLSAPALAAYLKATAPAWAAYRKATAPAWAAYEKAISPALARALRAIAPSAGGGSKDA